MEPERLPKDELRLPIDRLPEDSRKEISFFGDRGCCVELLQVTASNLTHFLGNKLAIVKGGLEIEIESQGKSKGESLMVALEGAEEIGRLTERLKVLSGVLPPNSCRKRPCDTGEFLDLIRNLLTKDEQKLVIWSTDQFNLVADGPRLGQAVVELIRNSIQATEDGEVRVIRVSFGREEEEAVISVSDNGRGIAAEVQEALSTPWFLNKGTEKIMTKCFLQNPGLGLTIASAIVGNHGGRLTFKSQEGIGTDFTIRVPLE